VGRTEYVRPALVIIKSLFYVSYMYAYAVCSVGNNDQLFVNIHGPGQFADVLTAVTRATPWAVVLMLISLNARAFVYFISLVQILVIIEYCAS
jgi:hypothetical protein